MAYRFFWRVCDSDSQTEIDSVGDMVAAIFDSPLSFRYSQNDDFKHHLLNHLNWSSDEPSPFISVFDDQDAAWRAAKKRVREGRRDVHIVEIECERDAVEYRNVNKLTNKLQIDREYVALGHSDHEWVFLHWIPEGAMETIASWDWEGRLFV